MNRLISMNKIRPGERAAIKAIDASSAVSRRLMDMGFLKNEKIECVGKSPTGDPSAYLVKGAVIAIRSSDCSNVLVEPDPEA